MARKLRVEYPGAIYQVMNRGDRREPIFRKHVGSDNLQWKGSFVIQTVFDLAGAAHTQLRCNPFQGHSRFCRQVPDDPGPVFIALAPALQFLCRQLQSPWFPRQQHDPFIKSRAYCQ